MSNFTLSLNKSIQVKNKKSNQKTNSYNTIEKF